MLGVLCQVCLKRPATTHLTELDPEHGSSRELHLCGACIRALKLDLHHAPPDIDQVLALSKGGSKTGGGGLHLNLAPSKASLATKRKRKEGKDLCCSSCGLTFHEFAANNRFGCSACYDAFGQPLLQALKEIHGGDCHLGRVPASADQGDSRERRLAQRVHLRKSLDHAVAKEQYEQAAAIRDQLQALEREQPP